MYSGPIDWHMNGVRLLKNLSVVRPFVISLAVMVLAGLGAGAVQSLVFILLGGLVPLAYRLPMCAG